MMGAGTALQAFTASFPPFAVFNIVSRIGGSPQHPVGNALLAEQFPASRIGSAIAVHVAGGNVGTVFVGFAAALTIGLIGWRGAVLALGSVAVVVAIGILIAVREARADGRGSHGGRDPGPPPVSQGPRRSRPSLGLRGGRARRRLARASAS